ncbi:MAG: DUF3887 domain-containing protein [Betaproteobacteria bacterium]|nr:DUF3887 domain-containing protein [Betaproteobacteria bacterium]
MDKAQIRQHAAQAVARLAERAVQRGTGDALDDGPIKPGWERSGADFGPSIKPAFLRQAVAYYDVAIEIDPVEQSFHYQQGLVLEQLSDFAAAIKAFEAAVDIMKEQDFPGGQTPVLLCQTLIERCRAKLCGTHDPGAALLEGVKKQREQFGRGDPPDILFSALQKVLAAVDVDKTFPCCPDSRSASLDTGEKAGMARDPAQPMIEFAERFVWLMVEQDFAAAHALLDTEMASACPVAELRQNFDALVAGIGEIEHIESDFTDLRDDSGEERHTMIYLSIMGSDDHEGVAVFLAGPDEGLRVCALEWGRP